MKKKDRRIIVLFSLIVMFCIISTSNRQISAQQDTMDSSANPNLSYENTYYGIKISYPANWACSQQEGQQPDSSASSESLIIMLCPPRENIDSDLIHSLTTGILAHQSESDLENQIDKALGRTASLTLWTFPSFNQPL